MIRDALDMSSVGMHDLTDADYSKDYCVRKCAVHRSLWHACQAQLEIAPSDHSHLLGLMCELVAESWVGDRDERESPLTQRLAPQFGDAELGDDVVDGVLRCRDD